MEYHDKKDNKPVDYSKYDLVGIGYPIYGFNVPKPVHKFIRKQNIRENFKDKVSLLFVMVFIEIITTGNQVKL
mgnify:CR=1 FL=1